MAAVGALLMSSGIALMATPMVASATQNQHQPVSVCHATSSDTNPYTFIVVDNDSVKLKGHLKHKTDPNKVWKSTLTWNGTTYNDGDAKRDYIGSYTDEKGVFHSEDGTFTEAWCEAGSNTEEAVADVDFTDPTCLNGNVGTFQADGEHASFDVDTSTPAAEPDTYEPGSYIKVVATADEGFMFANGRTELTFEHTFGAPEVGCEPLGPIVPEPPTFVDPTCTTDPAVQLPDTATDSVSYLTAGDVVAGGAVVVTATPVPPAVFAEGVTTTWSHTFTVPTGCTIVSPPEEPTTVSPTTESVTPTVVHAGLAGDMATTSRTGQGLGLALTGLLMMAASGGLVLAKGGARR